MTNFSFLEKEWTYIFQSSLEAEKYTFSSPRTACFYARHTLERAVEWMYSHDISLKRPLYSGSLGALIHEQCFMDNVPPHILPKVNTIQRIGNKSLHSEKEIIDLESLHIVKELFHFLYWFYKCYSEENEKIVMDFDVNLIPPRKSGDRDQSIYQLNELSKKLQEKDEILKETEKRLRMTEAELEKVKTKIQEIKIRNRLVPDQHDYNEEETRNYFIDLLLEEAGWNPHGENVREYPVTGMPNNAGEGFADYVLWGNNALPLAVIEAKRTKKDPHSGQHQARLYADCLEKMTGQRPVIFYSNGYQTYMWDDNKSTGYPPRKVSGFFSKDELELLIQRRDTRLNLYKNMVNRDIAGRYYQLEAIKRVAESFQNENKRKSLVVMATGTGKTRTVISAVDMLMRCNWVKRVLFLADRVALLSQAKNAFKSNIKYTEPEIISNPDSLPDSRICFSTYPTIMNCIEKYRTEKIIFGTGHFDLIIIDEAHRSVYKKYRAIFEYFDSLLIGLTATPRDEVDRNTYHLFELHDGMPTFAYESEQAYSDGFLVRPKAVSVEMKFIREGIKYSQLSEEEKEEYEEQFADEDTDIIPDRIEPSALNKWLFNEDTVNKVLQYLMENGIKVQSGDVIGKTIIFAKNHKHAEFIKECFDKIYPEYPQGFATVIDTQVSYAQDLIEKFSVKNSEPYIAISVDMLDTGIDIPEIVNLVFFKVVRSRTKFHQMIGRGTRLCKDLFGPDEDKKEFYIFDFCQNLEFFEEKPEGTTQNPQIPISKKIFTRRVELISHMKEKEIENPAFHDFRKKMEEELRVNVASLNNENIIVRSKKEYVDKYVKPESWENLTRENVVELVENVSELATYFPKEEETAKRFDLMILTLQSYLLENSPDYNVIKNKVISLASALEEKKTIPLVNTQMELILEIQTETFWQDINLEIIENIRKKLRNLIIFLDDKGTKKIVYTNFTDEVGMTASVNITGFEGAEGYKRYRQKVELFIFEHMNHISVHKLRHNIPLTSNDILSLEEILFSAELGSREEFESIFGAKVNNLGIFIRELVGLDREAAKEAFGKYLDDKNFNAVQIKFIDQIINYLTQNGTMDPNLLFERPFTDIHHEGISGLFSDDASSEIIITIKNITENALAVA